MYLFFYILFFSGVLFILVRSSKTDSEDLQELQTRLTAWIAEKNFSIEEKKLFVEAVKKMNTGELLYLYNYISANSMERKKRYINEVTNICRKYHLSNIFHLD